MSVSLLVLTGEFVVVVVNQELPNVNKWNSGNFKNPIKLKSTNLCYGTSQTLMQ